MAAVKLLVLYLSKARLHYLSTGQIHVIVFTLYRKYTNRVIWLKLHVMIPMIISRCYPNASSSFSPTSAWHTSRTRSPSWRWFNYVSHQCWQWCFRSREGKYVLVVHVRLLRKLGQQQCTWGFFPPFISLYHCIYRKSELNSPMKFVVYTVLLDLFHHHITTMRHDLTCLSCMYRWMFNSPF
jgi:hypothetical protein